MVHSLSRIRLEDGVAPADFVDALAAAYQEACNISRLGAERIQLDEPSLVKDLPAESSLLGPL